MVALCLMRQVLCMPGGKRAVLSSSRMPLISLKRLESESSFGIQSVNLVIVFGVALVGGHLSFAAQFWRWQCSPFGPHYCGFKRGAGRDLTRCLPVQASPAELTPEFLREHD